jgi:hypothetical protein
VVRVFVLLISACLCAGVAGAQRVDDILVRASRFVEETATRLSGVVADETYEQRVAQSLDISPRVARRFMRTEALFLLLRSAGAWMFVRNVVLVDGRPVPDSGERLDRLFNGSAIDVLTYLRQLQTENARFDIGSVVRTLGDPTFALRYLQSASQDRFSFSRDGTETVGTLRTTKLRYRERKRPFIVKVNGLDALSSGTVWVEPVQGTVVRTSLVVMRPTGRGVLASITVDFQNDMRIGAWAPSRMTERYVANNGETMTGVATYANFRRFDTSIRVIAPEDPN